MKIGDGVTDWVNLPYSLGQTYVQKAGDVMSGTLILPDEILTAIDETITATTVDVKVLNSALDDDGGVSHKNADLPQTLIIIAEATQIFIHDGGDSTIPLVHTITGLSGITSIAALNGQLWVGTATGVQHFDMLLGYAEQATPAIVNNAVNDVAMTSDGAMNNTIAVFTNEGCSVIDSSGSVFDVDVPNVQVSGSFNGQELTSVNSSGDVNIWNTPPTADATPPDKIITNAIGTTSLSAVKGLGSSLGATQLLAGSVTDITTASNSGLRYGDCKGAFLANSATVDRSHNNNSLVETGTISEGSVATGADLMGYSGWSATDYLEQPYNADLDFGTGDFYVMGWVKVPSYANQAIVFRGVSDESGGRYLLTIGYTGRIAFYSGTTFSNSAVSAQDLVTDSWIFIVATSTAAGLSIYLNAKLDANNPSTTDRDVDNSSALLRFGGRFTSEPFNGSLALWRIGAGAPTAEDVMNVYQAELPLFQENSKCLLSGNSSDVKALNHNPVTDVLTVCTATDVSKFSGLQRISEESRIATSVSAVGDLEVFGN